MDPLLSQIFETLADGVLVVSHCGQIVEANRAAQELTGFAREELKGQSCSVLNCTGCKRFAKGEGQVHCSLFASGGEKVVRCTILGKDGVAVPVLKRARVMLGDEGEVVGAVEILTDMRHLLALEARVDSLSREVSGRRKTYGIEGESSKVRQLLAFIKSVATSTAPVLILGESGSGKELVAQAIHEESLGSEAPFIKVNCAALNENLLESELFGHVKGAFTGASQNRMGRFEAAHGGTLFLDEIGDLPATIQVKLLRVLEEKVVERVGDHTPISVNARIITATHRALAQLVFKGVFREDLFFRINVIPVTCPPLKEREDDVLILAHRFLQRFALRDGRRFGGISKRAAALLSAYPWPGNVRELQNAMEYAMVLAGGSAIEPGHLPLGISGFTPKASSEGSRKLRIQSALEESGGVKSEAARLLGVSRVTLWKWMKHHKMV